MWRHADRERIADLLKYLVVGVGGFLGAVARYIVATYIGSRYGVRFPTARL
jgi:fluoride ion exporter CrcB/FEX